MNREDHRRLERWLVGNVKPATYVYLIQHEPDANFRMQALSFGYELSPKTTLPVLLNVARTDSDRFCRVMAESSILFAIASKRIPSQLPAVEKLALERLPFPAERTIAIELLSFYPTQRARTALRSIVTGSDPKFLRDWAAKALKRPMWDIAK